jgi:putative membrane protein
MFWGYKMKVKHKIPALLLAIYLVLFVFLAIEPYDRAVWWAENIPVWAVVLVLISSYASFKFSYTAYTLITIFVCYHTIGGHWGFEFVPFDWGNQMLSTLGFDFIFPEGRNNFDRLGHFLVGVFAYPLVEVCLRKRWVVNGFVAFCFAVFALGFFAAIYEVIEMVYAISEGGDSGAIFLGSQGDVWDAQKDIWMDICGAMLFAFLALFRKYDKRKL